MLLLLLLLLFFVFSLVFQGTGHHDALVESQKSSRKATEDVPMTSRVGHATPCGHEKCWKATSWAAILKDFPIKV